MPDNIYQALGESHETQRLLCRKLLRTKPGDPRRKDVFDVLRIELAAHAAAEERFLYAPMLMDDKGLLSSRHALAEHHEIDECVEKLAELDISAEGWLEQAKKLTETVLHHLEEEEKKFFQVSGKILTNTQKSLLAVRYRQNYVRMRRALEDAVL